MTTLRIPSSVIPAVPAVEFDLAEGWTAVPAPAVTAALTPVSGRPWSIIVSTLRVDAEDDLRSVAVRSFARQLGRHPGASIRAQRTGRFGDRVTYLREVALPATSDHGDTAQLQALFFAPGRGTVRDVFSFVGTCPSAQLDELGPVFVGVVASCRFVS